MTFMTGGTLDTQSHFFDIPPPKKEEKKSRKKKSLVEEVKYFTDMCIKLCAENAIFSHLAM